MLHFFCGALGLLGLSLYGQFLLSATGLAFRHGRTKQRGLPGCITAGIPGVTAPMLAAGALRFADPRGGLALLPAQVPDPRLFHLSELDQVRGPMEERRGRDLLDCQPVRPSARSQIGRRAATK